MNRAMNLFLAAAALGATTLAVAQDHAQPDRVDVRSVSVPYDAAQLGNEAATERLFFRIRLAAEQACDLSSNAVGQERWDEHACETEAVSNAIQTAGEPRLRDYYSQLHGSRMLEPQR